MAMTTLLVVTLGIAFISLYIVVQRSELQQLDEALFAHAEEEALEIVVAGGETKLSSRPGPTTDDVSRLETYAAVYDLDGHLVTSTASFACGVPDFATIRHPRGEPFDLRCGKLLLRAVFAKIPAHDQQRLLMAVPRTQLDDDRRFFVQTMLVVLVGSVLVAAIVARSLARGLARSQEAIASVARRVASGDLSARVGIHSSSQETQQLGHDIDEMIRQLGGLVQAQERFVANAAHEFRSPITALYGELQLAVRREREPAEYKEIIEHALESTRHLKSLAQDLLATAKIQHRQRDKVRFSLREMMLAAIKRVEEADRERKREYSVEGESAFSGSVGDCERMFLNLLENAARHAKSQVRVRIQDKTPTLIEVVVEDDGPGVPENERASLFDPFFRGARERASEDIGTGLGLPIARSAARLHGGDLTYDETFEGGARFVVILKREEGE